VSWKIPPTFLVKIASSLRESTEPAQQITRITFSTEMLNKNCNVYFTEQGTLSYLLLQQIKNTEEKIIVEIKVFETSFKTYPPYQRLLPFSEDLRTQLFPVASFRNDI